MGPGVRRCQEICHIAYLQPDACDFAWPPRAKVLNISDRFGKLLKDQITIAVIQHESVYGDVEGNVKRAFELVDQAVKAGAEMVCFSYSWYAGHSDGTRSPEFEAYNNELKSLLEKKEITVEQLNMRLMKHLAEATPSVWSQVADKARQHGIHIVAGSQREIVGDKVFHVSPVFGPDGKMIGKHKKSILWDRELLFVAPGDDWEVFDCGGVKIGNPICSEGQYVPEITRLLAMKGAEILVVPNGVHLSKQTLPSIPIARAIECQAFYAYCGTIPRGWRFPGVPKYASCIVSPIKHADPILAMGTEEGGYLIATLDLARLRKERQIGTPIMHDYRFSNAVNDMVEGKYSYPMLTEHFLKAQQRDLLLDQIVREARKTHTRELTVTSASATGRS